MEGVEVHHPLETAEREVRELDRADGDPAQGAVSKSWCGAVPAAAAVFQGARAAGAVPRHAAALLSLRLRISPPKLVRPMTSTISCMRMTSRSAFPMIMRRRRPGR